MFQNSLKCLRCARYMLGGEEIMVDPSFTPHDYYSHVKCIGGAVETVDNQTINRKTKKNSNNKSRNHAGARKRKTSF